MKFYLLNIKKIIYIYNIFIDILVPTIMKQKKLIKMSLQKLMVVRILKILKY